MTARTSPLNVALYSSKKRKHIRPNTNTLTLAEFKAKYPDIIVESVGPKKVVLFINSRRVQLPVADRYFRLIEPEVCVGITPRDYTGTKPSKNLRDKARFFKQQPEDKE